MYPSLLKATSSCNKEKRSLNLVSFALSDTDGMFGLTPDSFSLNVVQFV